MAQLNWAVRGLIKLIYGTALSPGTFEEAADAYAAAVAIAPHKMIHRCALCLLYMCN